ncbi:MAG: hypothetical protein ACFNZO_00465 [Candidatus Saccharibacteria bacterium]
MSEPSNKDILAWMDIYYYSIAGFIFFTTIFIMYDSTLKGREISIPILFVAGLFSIGRSVILAYKQCVVKESRSSQKVEQD